MLVYQRVWSTVVNWTVLLVEDQSWKLPNPPHQTAGHFLIFFCPVRTFKLSSAASMFILEERTCETWVLNGCLYFQTKKIIEICHVSVPINWRKWHFQFRVAENDGQGVKKVSSQVVIGPFSDNQPVSAQRPWHMSILKLQPIKTIKNLEYQLS